MALMSPFARLGGLIFLLLVGNFLAIPPLIGNEAIILPEMKHFWDSSFLAHDWAMAQTIHYRMLFNLLFGWPTLLLDLVAVSLLLRLFTFGIFAFSFARLATALDMPPAPAFVAFFLFSRSQSLVAGEWMIDGVETKVFAYICVLTSLTAVVKRDWRNAFLWTGLSVSFHVLIGLYASFGILCCWLVAARERSVHSSPSYLARSLAIFVLGDSVGIDSLLTYAGRLEAAQHQEAVSTLVNFRAFHHVNPSAWRDFSWPVWLIVYVVFFAWIASRSREWRLRALATMGLSSAMMFLLGL
jgi:hypothetical protein